MSSILSFFASACTDVSGLPKCDTGLPNATANSANLTHLLQVLFAIFGAVAVLMVVIGALNFINSEGDPKKAADARGTMIYALVGIVIAVSAEIVVSFVLGYF